MDFDLSTMPVLGPQYNETRIMDYISSVNNSLPEGEKFPEDIDYMLIGVNEDNFPYNHLSALRSDNEFHRPFKSTQTAASYERNRSFITDLSLKLMQSGGKPKAGFTTYECMRESTSERDANMIENRRQILIAYLGHLIRRLDSKDDIVTRIRIPSTSNSARYIAGSYTPVDIIAIRHFMNTLSVFDSSGFRTIFNIYENKQVPAPYAIYMHGIKAHGYIDLTYPTSRDSVQTIRLWFAPADLFWTNLTHQHELWLPVCTPFAIPSLHGVVYPTRFIDPYSDEPIETITLSQSTKDEIAEYSYLLTLVCQTLSLLARTIASSQGTKRSTWTPDVMNAGIRKMVLTCAALDQSFPHLSPEMDF